MTMEPISSPDKDQEGEAARAIPAEESAGESVGDFSSSLPPPVGDIVSQPGSNILTTMSDIAARFSSRSGGADASNEFFGLVIRSPIQMRFNEDLPRITLGQELLRREKRNYVDLGSPQDLDYWIQLVRSLSAAQVPDESHRTWLLGWLHTLLVTVRQEDELIEVAIQLLNLAKEECTEKVWMLASCLDNLAYLHNLRYERYGHQEYLDTAIDITGIVVTLTPSDDRRMSGRLVTHSIFLTERAALFGQGAPGYDSDADLAIENMSHAIVIDRKVGNDTTYGSQSREAVAAWIRYGRYLADLYFERYIYRRSINDIIRAVQMAWECLSALPPHATSEHKSKLLGILDEATNIPGLKDDGLEKEDAAGLIDFLESTSDLGLDQERRTAGLRVVSSWSWERFLISGNTQDIIRSSEAIQKVAQANRENLIYKVEVVKILCSRCTHTGNLDGIETAIEAGEQVLELAHVDMCAIRSVVYRLSSLYFQKWLPTRKDSDIRRCIDHSLRYVELSPPNTQAHILALFHYSTVLVAVQRAQKDFDAAVAAAKLAADMADPDWDFTGPVLANAANCMVAQIKRSGSSLREVVTEIDDLFERDVKLTPKTHLSWLGVVVKFSHFLHFEVTEADEISERSISRLKKAAELLEEVVQQKLSVNHNYSLAPGWLATLSQIYELLFYITDIMEARKSQDELLLPHFGGLACDAAASALEAGKSDEDALKTLEAGRDFIAELLLEILADVSDLKLKHPEMAQEFVHSRDMLDNSLRDGDATALFSMTQKEVANSEWKKPHMSQYELDMKFRDVVTRIRALPKFENFLLPPGPEELRQAASLGPIVVINASKIRCDAIIVTSAGIKSFPLDKLSYKDIEDKARTLKLFGVSHLMLEWLWDVIAGPILEQLGFVTVPAHGDWPRVWWIMTGPLNNFPIHVAGYHREGSTDTVLDRVMSTYCSSFKTLIHSRCQKAKKRASFEERAEKGNQGDPTKNVVVVSMPITPGSIEDLRIADLPFAAEEAEIVKAACLSMDSKLKVIEPACLKKDVLEQLPGCEVFHYAGHGVSQPLQPSKSHLLLEDWITNPLTVQALRDLRLQDNPPFLAVLSACSTVSMDTQRLADEGIHLVSAFQLAGFTNVVGTLWPVSDPHCAEVAKILYKTIKERGMTDAAVCLGLHEAVMALRYRTEVPLEANGAASDCSGSQTGVVGTQSHDNTPEAEHDAEGSGETIAKGEQRGDRRVRPVGSSKLNIPAHMTHLHPRYWAPYILFG
ncbi:CHAT domain-containing protein [Cladorrhinum sp. PSN259]|nr:CHAT domain-containing protein [Cladorrhinum sp. PSN259]